MTRQFFITRPGGTSARHAHATRRPKCAGAIFHPGFIFISSLLNSGLLLCRLRTFSGIDGRGWFKGPRDMEADRCNPALPLLPRG